MEMEKEESRQIPSICIIFAHTVTIKAGHRRLNRAPKTTCWRSRIMRARCREEERNE